MYKNIKTYRLYKQEKDFTKSTFWEIHTLKKRLKKDDKTLELIDFLSYFDRY